MHECQCWSRKALPFPRRLAILDRNTWCTFSIGLSPSFPWIFSTSYHPPKKQCVQRLHKYRDSYCTWKEVIFTNMIDNFQNIGKNVIQITLITSVMSCKPVNMWDRERVGILTVDISEMNLQLTSCDTRRGARQCGHSDFWSVSHLCT